MVAVRFLIGMDLENFKGVGRRECLRIKHPQVIWKSR
jgi:hypothetical protein